MIIVTSKVRALAKANNKRVSKEFLAELDRRVTNKVLAACKTHNGGRVTLDATICALTFGGVGL